jgi:hypothetical protein
MKRTKSRGRVPNQEEDQVKGLGTKPRGGPSQGIGNQTKRRIKSRGRALNKEED